MFYSIEGKVSFKNDKFCVIEAGGIGFKVFMPPANLTIIPENNDIIKVYTCLDVKEKGMDLYGFLSREDLELFETLIGISGIGPKASLKIISAASAQQLKKSFIEKDFKILEGISGLGKKRIQTIILELTGKLQDFQNLKGQPDEAEDGLVNLGFSRQEAKKSLRNISLSLAPEQRVREALKSMTKAK